MKKLLLLILTLFLLISPFSALASQSQSETVVALETVNIRTKPTIESEILAVLKKGSTITRIEETNDGWSKVLYENNECFIKSEYLMLADKEESSTVNETTSNTVPEEKVDNSTPRFMVTGYELSNDGISPNKTATLSITFKNYSTTKAIYNIKLSLTDPSGEIVTTKMPTMYVKSISALGSYTWKTELSAVNTATIGSHDLIVTAEYEDKNYSSYSSSDTVRIDVKQKVKIKYTGATLAQSLVQGSTQTLTLTVMNTGKSTIYNCTVDFDIENIQAAGSVYIGNIEEAQSADATTNLRVDSDALGKSTGKIIISYEDAYGNEYKKTADVSTIIKEKVVLNEETQEKESENKNNLWWLFSMIGVIIGAAGGSFTVWLIKDRKQRKEDDLKL